eukprot:TRINITY_DN2965_c0_g6_i1.p1 TRINITY_DN2965_c0_g6~~TRINITY_DN2965_c0_g6_i1.p1  ORF type:complete len:489 (+),score=145.46 TRINITY_DN2965_c0_g6_i1:178-1467(+)
MMINDKERRLSRKKVIASPCRCFAVGGYCSQEELTEPFDCIVITAAGAQFEKRGSLECRDFIIDDKFESDLLFPNYYTHGNPPRFSELKTRMDRNMAHYRKVHREAFFDSRAYFTSMVEDVDLILSAFDQMVKVENDAKYSDEPRKGIFKATAIGMGFFASLFMRKSIAQHLVPLLLLAFEHVLTHKSFPNIDVIEFPDFMSGAYVPNWIDEIEDIEIRSTNRDVMDFSNEEKMKYVCGVLNAGDCFCIPGNERGYSSVEAMIGNNTDMRWTQAYFANSALFDLKNYISVDAMQLDLSDDAMRENAKKMKNMNKNEDGAVIEELSSAESSLKQSISIKETSDNLAETSIKMTKDDSKVEEDKDNPWIIPISKSDSLISGFSVNELPSNESSLDPFSSQEEDFPQKNPYDGFPSLDSDSPPLKRHDSSQR